MTRGKQHTNRYNCISNNSLELKSIYGIISFDVWFKESVKKRLKYIEVDTDNWRYALKMFYPFSVSFLLELLKIKDRTQLYHILGGEYSQITTQRGITKLTKWTKRLNFPPFNQNRFITSCKGNGNWLITLYIAI